jgi:hypothetical protein
VATVWAQKRVASAGGNPYNSTMSDPEIFEPQNSEDLSGNLVQESAADLPPMMAARIEVWPIDKLTPYARNSKLHPPEQVQKIAASILRFGFLNPVLVDEQAGEIIAGHGRRLAAELLGMTEVPVVPLAHLSAEERRAYLVTDNRLAELGGWDETMLAAELAAIAGDGFDLDVIGFEPAELAELAESLTNQTAPERSLAASEAAAAAEVASETLAHRFGVPPFSTLDTRAGYWLTRKRAWLALGISSEVGRPDNLLGFSDTALAFTNDRKGEPAWTGTSIFDPVAAELSYRWWCPEGGRILDPFAGGSVRGIVAAKLGFTYVGIELRREQIEANEAQAERILGAGYEKVCRWVEGDSTELAKSPQLTSEALGGPFDFVFSCPPYFDLEKYSDDPRDLSNAANWPAFVDFYGAAIRGALLLLAEDRFAAFVVSDVRAPEGHYRGLPHATTEAFASGGASLYNEAIIVQPVGTAAMRAARIFSGGRKLARCHQKILVYSSGNPERAELRELWGDTQFAEIEGAAEGTPGLEPLLIAEPEQLPAEAPEGFTNVTVSAVQARQLFHGCEPDYIRDTCHASCCRSSRAAAGFVVAVLPEEQPPLEQLGASFDSDGLLLPKDGAKHCQFEEQPTHLCALHEIGIKPSGCISSPFSLNKKDRLVVANRYRLLRCYKDSGPNAKPAYIAFRASLDLLFGDEVAASIHDHLEAGGGDMVAPMPDARRAALLSKAETSKAATKAAK